VEVNIAPKERRETIDNVGYFCLVTNQQRPRPTNCFYLGSAANWVMVMVLYVTFNNISVILWCCELSLVTWKECAILYMYDTFIYVPSHGSGVYGICPTLLADSHFGEMVLHRGKATSYFSTPIFPWGHRNTRKRLHYCQHFMTHSCTE